MLEQWFSWLLPILQFLEPYLSKLQSVSFLVACEVSVPGEFQKV
jgi:hypothetical protein